jgi:hypothetical protein
MREASCNRFSCSHVRAPRGVAVNVGLGAGVSDGIDFVGEGEGVTVGSSGVLVNVGGRLAVKSGVAVFTAVTVLCPGVTVPWQATKNIMGINKPAKRKCFVIDEDDISLTKGLSKNDFRVFELHTGQPLGMVQNPTTSSLFKQVSYQKTVDLFIKPSLDAGKLLMLLCQKPETFV